ncbi:MAG: DUF1266 domain-containing protein [Treponema sp.]
MKRSMLFCIALMNMSIGFALSDAQRWALALTEIMTEVNHDSHETLNFSDRNEENKARYEEMLDRDWGIHNREELLETITKVECDGHAAALKEIKDIMNDTKYLSLFTLLSDYELSERKYNYFKFTLANWTLFSDRTIIAWDYGRCIALCRWGYDCGYLTEQEAWEKIFYYAQLIQPLYTDWKEYGFDYYMGRLFFAAGFCEEVAYAEQTDKIYRKLIGPGGYWRMLEWNISLE